MTTIKNKTQWGISTALFVLASIIILFNNAHQAVQAWFPNYPIMTLAWASVFLSIVWWILLVAFDRYK